MSIKKQRKSNCDFHANLHLLAEVLARRAQQHRVTLPQHGPSTKVGPRDRHRECGGGGGGLVHTRPQRSNVAKNVFCDGQHPGGASLERRRSKLGSAPAQQGNIAGGQVRLATGLSKQRVRLTTQNARHTRVRADGSCGSQQHPARIRNVGWKRIKTRR